MTMISPEALSLRDLRGAFGLFPSGVTALCALVDGRPTGLALSSFTSVSLEPPLVSICIGRSSTTWPSLGSAARFGLSVLASGHSHVARALSSQLPDRFEAVQWTTSESGALFIEGAALWLDCTKADMIPAGDHDIVTLAIHKIQANPEVEPLVFHRSQFWRLGDPRTVEARQDSIT